MNLDLTQYPNFVANVSTLQMMSQDKARWSDIGISGSDGVQVRIIFAIELVYSYV